MFRAAINQAARLSVLRRQVRGLADEASTASPVMLPLSWSVAAWAAVMAGGLAWLKSGVNDLRDEVKGGVKGSEVKLKGSEMKLKSSIKSSTSSI